MTERLSFSLALLANAADAPKPLQGCDNGHLVVANNTHWQPERFSFDLKSLTCVAVESCDA